MNPEPAPWLVTERQYPDALNVTIFYLLADGRRRPVTITRDHDLPQVVAAIGDALAGDVVISKEQAKRLGWRAGS